MSKYVVCLTTVSKIKDAERIARVLLQKRLAACVTVVSGGLSFYRWKGKTCRDREFVLIMKTVSSKAEALERELGRIHPYELPEFVVLPVAGGSRRYLKWIRSEVKTDSR